MSPTQSRTTLTSVISSARDAKAHPRTSPASTRESVHISHEEWAAQGKAARRDAPRKSHANWRPAADRPDPVALLEEQAESRVPELVPIRYGRMLVSPFTFYRGARVIMAADLAADAGLRASTCSSAATRTCSNFGVFASPERQLVFDINDFDETLPGPWEWDVKRLAASFEVAGRDRGFYAGRPARHRSSQACASTARRCAGLAQMGALEVWYAHLDVDDLIARIEAEVRAKRLGKKQAKDAARSSPRPGPEDSLQALRQARPTWSTAELRIISDPPLIVPIDELCCRATAPTRCEECAARRCSGLPAHAGRRPAHLLEEFRYVDAARKVVGVGSVGTRAWIVLLLGRDERRPAVPAGQGGAGLGAGARSSARASTRTTASASSRASA